jgi:hypothetical protein
MKHALETGHAVFQAMTGAYEGLKCVGVLIEGQIGWDSSHGRFWGVGRYVGMAAFSFCRIDN